MMNRILFVSGGVFTACLGIRVGRWQPLASWALTMAGIILMCHGAVGNGRLAGMAGRPTALRFVDDKVGQNPPSNLSDRPSRRRISALPVAANI
jgi:hypothetical protein